MAETPANWYPDPHGRAELRYWDGVNWTEHISNDGVQGTDVLSAPPPPDALDRIESIVTVDDGRNPEAIRKQVTGDGYRGAGIAQGAASGGGSVFDEPILVVNQKAKLVELSNQYAVFAQDGQQLASVNQVGQSKARKALRLLSNVDQFLSHTLDVTNNAGQTLMRITRPAKIMKSTVIVENGAGHEIGRIVQKNMFGKINFALESGGHELGAIKAENWRAWNFRIEDAAGTEVARITKTFEGFAKTLFTTADNYVVQVHQRPPDPLNTLIVAAALCIDTALKQDDR